ncbi:hypothetical protein K439DRAFT_1635625 [Ramaria rubella]|nr:hypothetical protein K439DRAFT_1635625 [Ramaria rubella]
MASPHRANTHSPTSSLSGSSFSMLASTQYSSDDPFEAIDESSSDGDEILWTANEYDPDEDFILVPQVRTHPEFAVTSGQDIEALSQLSLRDYDSVTPAPSPAAATFPSSGTPLDTKHLGGDRRSAGDRSNPSGKQLALTAVSPKKTHRGRRRRGRKDASTSYPSPSPSPERNLAGSVSPSREESDTYFEERTACFGEEPFIEESDGESVPVFTKYEDAVCFITSFLSNPSAALSSSTYTRLTFLQSLIIELGLMSPRSALPSSLTAAKRLLKSRAFINIGEYLSVREQGLDKLQEIMFHSKRELTSDLRKKKGGRKADRGWVKRHGLNVLLVSVF